VLHPRAPGPVGAMATVGAEAALDMSLDDVIASSRGSGGRGSKGKGRGKGGGKGRGDGTQASLPNRDIWEDDGKASGAAAALDMSLDDVIESSKGSGKSGRKGKSGGKGEAGSEGAGGGRWGSGADDTWGGGKKNWSSGAGGGGSWGGGSWDKWNNKNSDNSWEDWGGSKRGGAAKDGSWSSFGSSSGKDSWETWSKKPAASGSEAWGGAWDGRKNSGRDDFWGTSGGKDDAWGGGARSGGKYEAWGASPREEAWGGGSRGGGGQEREARGWGSSRPAPDRWEAEEPRGRGGSTWSSQKRRHEDDSPPERPTKSIKVKNIPHDLDWRDIKGAFEAEAGKILRCELEKGTAWITFVRPEDARKAVETFDRGELNGKTIEVSMER